MGFENDGLYLIDTPSVVASPIQQVVIPPQKNLNKSSFEELSQWHNRLGHPSFSLLKQLFPQLGSPHSQLRCEPCKLAKHCHLVYLISHIRSSSPFNLVHSDIWGPSPAVSLFGFRYFITFIDDYSRATWVYLMKAKSDVFSIVKSFIQMVAT